MYMEFSVESDSEPNDKGGKVILKNTLNGELSEHTWVCF